MGREDKPRTRGDEKKEYEEEVRKVAMEMLAPAASRASMKLQEKMGGGKMSATAMGRKDWWPSNEDLERLELHVGLFWQLPRVYLHFWTNEEGGKRLKEESEAQLKEICTMPEPHDPDYEEIAKAMARWDVYLRMYVYKTTNELDEAMRSVVAIRGWCQHGWDLLSPELQKDVLAKMPKHVAPPLQPAE